MKNMVLRHPRINVTSSSRVASLPVDSPQILKASAVFKSIGRNSSVTFTSPLYMNVNKVRREAVLMSCSTIIGSLWGFCYKKKCEWAYRIHLCKIDKWSLQIVLLKLQYLEYAPENWTVRRKNHFMSFKTVAIRNKCDIW